MNYKLKLDLLEKEYNENKTVKNALILAKKYRTAYKLTNSIIYIKKALVVINERMAENNLDARLILYKSYFAYLDNELEECTSYLKLIKQGKNYYRENDINIYLQYLYISGLVSQREKYIKLLTKYIPEYSIASCYIADLMADNWEFEKCYEYLSISFNKRCRNPILFEILYKYFNVKNVLDNNHLLFKLLNWCYCHNVDFSHLMISQRDKISIQVEDNVSLAMKIYENYEEDYLLEKICNTLVSKSRTDEKAFLLYLKASKKQIPIENLNKMLILSSYKNNYENISYFFMKNFLQKESITSDIKGFIYHLLINNENLNQLLAENNMDIVAYSIFAVDNDFEDMYHLSIYKYCLLNQEKFSINEAFIDKMEMLLFSNLFRYKVEVAKSNINLIGIKEEEKNELSFFPVENNIALVEASTSEFNYYFFSENNNVIKEIPIIKPMVYSLDIDIYIYFYNKGKRNSQLLVSCCNYCLDNNINKDIMLNILKEASDLKGLTKEYLNKINMFIGSVYLSKKEYENGLKYFEKIDNTGLTGDYVEKMLVVFLETENYKKASLLLLSKRHKISDGVIIYALEKLANIDDIKKDRELVRISYEMIIKGSFNLQLINLVLNEYNSTLEDLLKFYKVIEKRNIFNTVLAEKIICSSMKNRVINPLIEEVFGKLYNKTNLNEMTVGYITYIAYEVIKNSYVIEDTTLEILEEICRFNRLGLLALTLSYYYKNIENYDIIKLGIEEMEKSSVFFPIMKEKFFSSYGEYVNKYQPFVYNSEKGREVFFHYKLKDDMNFKKVSMSYVRFGIFMTKIIMFYNESVEYYFEEVFSSGSLISCRYYYTNKDNTIYNVVNEYAIINKAYILQENFKYNDVENVITSFLNNKVNFIGQLQEGE